MEGHGRVRMLDNRRPFRPIYGVGRGILLMLDGLVAILTLGVVQLQSAQLLGWRVLLLDAAIRGEAKGEDE